jgi:hypothetical protein
MYPLAFRRGKLCMIATVLVYAPSHCAKAEHVEVSSIAVN